VGLHDRALLRREGSRLEQDRVRDRHLADVVQRRGVADPLAELRIHPDLFGEQSRKAPDPLDVGTGVLVPELHRHGQPPHGLGLRDLELCECAFQLARAPLDLFAQRDAAALSGEPPEQRGPTREHDYADRRQRRCTGEGHARAGRDREKKPRRPSQQRGRAHHARAGRRSPEAGAAWAPSVTDVCDAGSRSVPARASVVGRSSAAGRSTVAERPVPGRPGAIPRRAGRRVLAFVVPLTVEWSGAS